MKLFIKIVFCCVIIGVILCTSEAKRKRKKVTRMTMVLRDKETNPVNFVRLAVMRLVYGLATRFGLEEQLSEVLNGAFVPPGVDSDYGDYRSEGGSLFEDDYDY